MPRAVLVLVTASVFLARFVYAQTAPPVASAPTPPALPVASSGPAAPEPPATISRDGLGRATLRATRLTTPLRIDGKLDEAVYESVPPMSDFIQVEPVEHAPATEKTEVWVFFDNEAVYVVGRCWETQPERMIANEMRRDSSSIPQNENFAWTFDTFYDRRNGVFFEMNPLGGRFDAQVTNERVINTSWNPVWESKTGRFENGWTVETKIPFKSLRYRPGKEQVWGFQVRRKNQWKGEISFLGPLPRTFGMAGHVRAISLSPAIVGLEAPSGAKNIDIKPYAISNLTTDTNARPRISNDVDGDFGVDVKYGVTQNLTADITYNTDFAQVEADEQQINLTRFSLFFPEKRDFFQENQGTFNFGSIPQSSNQVGAVTDPPTLFYSRRIGLDRTGQEVPIIGGIRLTGQTGRIQLGMLNVQSDDVAASHVRSTNFSVVRIKSDVLRKSSVGLIYAGRSVSESGSGQNHAFGVDSRFGLFDDLNINTFWARTSAQSGDNASYRAQLDYAGDRYGVELEHLAVGKHFNPEVGFVRRPDMRRNFGSLRFSPRPRASKSVRKWSWTGSFDHIANGSTSQLETRTVSGLFLAEFQNNDKLTVNYFDHYEFLPAPLMLAPGVTVPVGGYAFQNVQAGYAYAPTRKVASGSVTFDVGDFYGGTKTTVTVTQGRLTFPPHLSLEPNYSINKVDVPQGAFTTHLFGSRVNLSMTPLMFVGALLQYNSTSHSLASNVRFRWEYQPGSELFVVYNDQRDTLTRGFPDVANRAFIVKVNRLFRF